MKYIDKKQTRQIRAIAEFCKHMFVHVLTPIRCQGFGFSLGDRALFAAGPCECESSCWCWLGFSCVEAGVRILRGGMRGAPTLTWCCQASDMPLVAPLAQQVPQY